MNKSSTNIHCETLHANISVNTCLKRQEIAQRKVSPAFGATGENRCDFSMCIDCKTGKGLKKKKDVGCIVKGCDGIHKARGLCIKHYTRIWRDELKKKNPKKYQYLRGREDETRILMIFGRIKGEKPIYLNILEKMAKEHGISKHKMAKKLVIEAIEFYMNNKKSIYA